VKKFISELVREQWLFMSAALLTIVVYAVFFSFGYISWDDPEMVFRNKDVANFDIKAFFTRFYVGNYIPFTLLIHSLCQQIGGDSALVFHATNIFIHLLNGWLVLRFSRLVFKNETISITAMLVFLLHPLQVESVGWISELKNVLYVSFLLAALINYLHYIESKTKKHLILAFVFFVSSCLSKPSAVVFPLLLIVLDVFSGEKISGKSVLRYLPFFGVALLFGAINMKAQTAAQFINHAHEFPIWQRLAFSGFGIARYLGLFLFPLHLSIIYPYPEASVSVLGLGIAALTLLAVLLFFLIKRKSFSLLFCILFFVLNLILVLQFLPFGEVLNADRYMYLPILGLAWPIGMAIEAIKLPKFGVWLPLVLLLGFSTFSRAQTWKNALQLYENILKQYPDAFIALNSAGVECMFSNQDKKALQYFDHAIKSNPKNYKGYYNRGLLYLKNSKPAEAIASFNECLALYDYVKAYAGRASAYYQLHDFPKALNDAKHALNLDPTNAKAHFVLGNCYNDLNQLAPALAEYNAAIAIQGGESDYYFKRAIVYGKQQDFKSSLGDLDICLKLNPNYHEAHYWKGVVKINLNEDACAEFEIAARQNFEPAVAAYNKYCR
jgi:Tfp pilus assembly protein PilF